MMIGKPNVRLLGATSKWVYATADAFTRRMK
jgi:hypothetical protein